MNILKNSNTVDVWKSWHLVSESGNFLDGICHVDWNMFTVLTQWEN